MSPVHLFLSETASRILPRILTQICRDPSAPFYGACDRNWWHYKIRDFPSIIIQQAGYALHIAGELEADARVKAAYNRLAAATATFWNQRALRHGAFEEYYPYEQGYPPVAFATLGVAKLCQNGVVSLPSIRSGLTIAASQLLTRFEAQAANQQIAGTAALSVIRTLDRSLIDENKFQKILTDVLSLQHQEGWFPEYDGPDLGYLAVSIDCLWDIHDHTADPRILPAIRKAAEYIAWFALNPIGTAGMHNSRNTDYITPYGLVRLAIEENNLLAAASVEKLFTRSNVAAISSRLSSSDFHPFDAVDDRYWCHYIGHSVLRAVAILKKNDLPTYRANVPTASSQAGSGHALIFSPQGAAALISTRKGGIVTAKWPDGATASDFGWVLHDEKKLFVSHWWSTDWKTTISETSVTTEGYLVSHKEHLSEPWKHIILRLAACLLGRRLIGILKKLVIFKKPHRTHHFTRVVFWENATLVITDKITGLSKTHALKRAPRASKRHVASADSFHPQDMALLVQIERVEKTATEGSCFACQSYFSAQETSKR